MNTETVPAPPRMVASPACVIKPADPGPEATFCIIGVPRSGTSMVAGILRMLGIPMGERVDPDNNEDLDFLGHNGDRDVFRSQERVGERAAYLERIRHLICERNASLPRWGWKDPLALYYAEEVVAELRNPHFILVTRDIGAVALREFLEEAPEPERLFVYLNRLAAEYGSMSTSLTRMDRPTLLVSYERGLRHPAEMIEEIAAFVGMDALEPARLAEIIRYVVPDRLTGRLAAEGIDIVGSLPSRLESGMREMEIRLAAAAITRTPPTRQEMALRYIEAARALNAGELHNAEDLAISLIAQLGREFEALRYGPDAFALALKEGIRVSDTWAMPPDVVVGLYHILGMVCLQRENAVDARRYFSAAIALAERRLAMKEPDSVQSAHLLWHLKLHEGIAYAALGQHRPAQLCFTAIVEAGEGIAPRAIIEGAGRPSIVLVERANRALL